MFTYQKSNRFFAQIARGLEESGTREFEELGARNVKPAFSGIHFECDIRTLYHINYMARLPTRILAPLLTFDCHSTKYLYRTARKIAWNDIFGPEQTFAIFCNVANSAIRHSNYAALCLKDAIVDTFRDAAGDRPSVDPKNPDVWFSLHIEHNRATISLDTSGGSLHKRGYRKASVEAPMQENLAAAIIRISRWDAERPLYDPLCGSGTLLCEALMSHCKIPSGYLSPTFGFRFLPEFDKRAWKEVKDLADSGITTLASGLIRGSDIDAKAVGAARENASRLPSGGKIQLHHSRFQDLDGIKNATIVCNPPYGVRLGTKDSATALIKEFGNFLKQKCKGSDAYVYFGEKDLLNEIGLRPSWKKSLRNGGLDGRLARFNLY